MKYIRTKEKIYEIDETCKKDNQILFSDNKEQTPDYIIDFFEGKDALKQADTIEELCDELVVHNPDNDGDFYPKYFVYLGKWENMLKPMSDYQKSHGIEIYGAIWADKGLIYVAKMNEKGKLELI